MTALYIHIPFCLKKCSYCDFVSYAGQGAETINRYIKALETELLQHKDFFRQGISTIYFGGGTPSLLSAGQFENIFTAIIKSCPRFTFDIEITAEVNPATADAQKLADYKKTGINRISLGVQTFNEKHLISLGRSHTAREAVQTYEHCRQARFQNINLDLMFALPGQTCKEWQADLTKAVSLAPEHLSAYNLQVEEGTPLWERVKGEKPSAGKLQMPSEQEDARMYVSAVEYLATKGYHRYEISNFASMGRECLHNIAYWANKNYIGVGVAAHSHIEGKRWANTASIRQYLGSSGKAVAETIQGTPVSRRQETIFLGLRMAQGVEVKTFKGYEKEVKALESEGLLEKKGDRYRLTERGVLLANRVFEHFV